MSSFILEWVMIDAEYPRRGSQATERGRVGVKRKGPTEKNSIEIWRR